MFNYENSKNKRSVLFTLNLNELYVWNKNEGLNLLWLKPLSIIVYIFTYGLEISKG